MFESVDGCKTRGVGWAGEKCGIANNNNNNNNNIKDSCIAAMAPVTRNKLRKDNL